ncbi:mechanosensitive ion channel domain-containing protein [Vibrio aestuarianus]|uniref:Small-conductance mechanosensitive channel n=1 Tax=Vibrio aestuarianus TaxID=28171 RepID=A0AAX3U966_9VIBR|nr:mechanosensitive ion channel domain-containing protein [Vibrio aestuarianus]MDE1214611.1 mechanosensitive ion channel family protein [Vibrio aestuarianus]MDE1218754.1 mechanosensitive ion channel family protein [Vibrio aestuarianus]MDE1229035.1 mechanosensitive ion channel family protein [Vibrio aestuarianus]MDE1231195.1 mechanosensitive ion channel family protein [Vibrio aestuarianus]MDE1239336.1 mechanosensitive ion channel family protein [Vibrio aestuarianus]
MDYLNLFQLHYQWFITAIVLICYPTLAKYCLRFFENMVIGKADIHRLKRARWLVKSMLFTLLIIAILMMWGVELRGLLVVGSSLFALLGVGLFAAWSLLSNVTSFLVLFVQNNCRIGLWVRVVDGANMIEGKIVDMNLLNVVLENIDGNKILYPNNLFIIRPVIVLNTAPEKAVKKKEKRQLPTGVTR